jgi:hypothetical protein
MILTGYILCLIGLFIGCVIVQGFYVTLTIYGIIHLGCALGLFFFCQRVAAKRPRRPVYYQPLLPERLSTTDPESDWVITVSLN